PGINPMHVEYTIVLPKDLFQKLSEAGKQIDTLYGLDEFYTDPDFPPPPKPAGTIYFDRSVVKSGDAVDLQTTGRESDVKRITAALGEARNNSSVVIASIHSHEARKTLDQPDLFLQPFARACIDAGADVFFGTGPHVIRGIEIYKGKPIFYSLGNY